MTKATYIPLRSNPGKSSALDSFLKVGRDLVVKTEPQTTLWYALGKEGAADRQAIFDFFPDQAGRDAHFAGQVAGALKENAADLVHGGWNDGVLANVFNYEVLAAKLDASGRPVNLATLVELQAQPGKAEELAGLLRAGRDIVAATVPDTLSWFALRQEASPDRLAIFDLFENDSGRAAHFAGKVAAALKDSSATLVEGGWEEGVLKNITHFSVRAAK